LQEHSGAPLASSNWLGPGPLGLVSSTRAASHLKRTRREQALAAHRGCRNVIENYRSRSRRTRPIPNDKLIFG
jgi:hypothetical protein